MKIALIVGHSTESQGASNGNHDISEFQFNDVLAGKIRTLAEDAGYEVVIAYRETTYSKLPGQVNREHADAIISLHCNAYNKEASGTEMLYYHKSLHGKSLAGNLQYRIKKTLGLSDRGYKAKTSEDRGGYLLRYTNAPCVIAEPFFIDNDSDLLVAQDRMDELAKSYVDGINDWKNGIAR